MKLVVPITSPEDIAPLLRAGADEFYCGVYDEECMKGMEFSIWNKRPSVRMNFNSLQELKAAIAAAHEARKEIFLTLNSLYYIEEHYCGLKKITEQTYEMGIDGYIVSDPGIINLIDSLGLKTRIHASTTASVYNSKAVKFFKSMGVERIIFPRHMNPREMIHLSQLDEDMDYEAFMMNSKCPNEDGFCMVEHSNNFFAGVSGCFFSNKFMDLNASKNEEYISVCKFISDACGACIIPDLMKSNIKYLKIVGRENVINKIVKDTIFLKRVLKECQSDSPDILERVKEVYENTYGSSCFGLKCYYPAAKPAYISL